MPVLINEIEADIESATDISEDDSGLEDIMPLEQDEYEIVSTLDLLRQRRQRLSVD